MFSILATILFSTAFASPFPQQTPKSCSPLELVIARGTGEPGLPYGVIVGDPLMRYVKRVMPKATGYAVSYPATMAKTSKAQGAADVVKHLTAQSAACPQQKYVLVGYSQGADVQHEASKTIPKTLYPRIVGVVMFGDPGNKGPMALSPMGGRVPMFPTELQAKTKQNCAVGDPVCSSGTNMMAHLTYGGETYMKSSAEYVKKQFETGGKAGEVKAGSKVAAIAK